MKVLSNACLKNFCSYKIGGNACKIVFPKNLIDLKTAICLSKISKLSKKVIGNASNILFSDNGYAGMVISLKRFKKIRLLKNDCVFAEPGAMLCDIFMFAKRHGLVGFEWAGTIPATVGGAIVNNAGCFGFSMQDFVVKVKCLNESLNIETLSREDIKFDYRSSCFKLQNKIIVGVVLKFKKGDVSKSENKFLELINLRNQKQPKGFSCGSVFKNPEGYSAGELIDKCGLKGLRLGDAQVSEKHANFILNLGNAKNKDVRKLIEIIRSIVYNIYNIKLDLEVEFVE